MAKQATKATKQNVLTVDKKPEKHKEQVHADLAVDPAVTAAIVVQSFGKSHIGPLEIGETLNSVSDMVRAVRKGDYQDRRRC